MTLFNSCCCIFHLSIWLSKFGLHYVRTEKSYSYYNRWLIYHLPALTMILCYLSNVLKISLHCSDQKLQLLSLKSAMTQYQSSSKFSNGGSISESNISPLSLWVELPRRHGAPACCHWPSVSPVRSASRIGLPPGSSWTPAVSWPILGLKIDKTFWYN